MADAVQLDYVAIMQNNIITVNKLIARQRDEDNSPSRCAYAEEKMVSNLLLGIALALLVAVLLVGGYCRLQLRFWQKD